MTRARILGMALALVVVVLAVIGPALASDPLTAAPDGLVLQGPTATHWLGTDQFGRDLLARLAHGARLSLGIAGLAITIALVLGSFLGLLAGGRDGLGAALTSRAIDLALSLPRVVVLLVLVAAIGTLGPLPLAVILGLTGWPAIARLTRGEAARIRHAPHVLAARALGATPRRQLLAHVLPGTLPAALVAATLGVADVLLLEAGLSFLGIGVQPPTPTWGNMILEAQGHLASAPRLLLVPALALVTATAAATLLGDALRARLSPHGR